MNGYLALSGSFAICLILNFILLPLLKKLKAGQQILSYVSEHDYKKGTPTMGGIGFIVSIAVGAWVFVGFKNRTVAVAIAVFVAYGVVGFLDDFIKIYYKRNLGLKAYQKIIVQLAIALLVAWYVYKNAAIGSKLSLPFTDKKLNLKFWIVPLTVFIYLACTNGVNLTDGLDGLATGAVMCYLFGMILVLGKESVRAEGVGDTLSAQTIENMASLCYVGIGALAAFLPFNAFPAKVFMGDTGSMALGALVACVSIFSRASLFIPIVGLTFVVSCLSVIVQVVYYKMTKGKRVFLMAPFHHHLQKRGWSECRICVVYCLVTMLSVGLLMAFGE